jgi:ATP-binding cassette subfamily F protein 3
LLLDEPTNHLDLATREALGMALNEFDGTVMLVSHDRALLRAVCDEFWLVTRGGVEPFDGDLDDYQRYLLDEGKRLREHLKESNRASREPVAVATPVKKASPDQRRPLRQSLDKIDQRLTLLNADKAALESRLSLAPPHETAELATRLQGIYQEISALEEEWLGLTETLEALG